MHPAMSQETIKPLINRLTSSLANSGGRCASIIVKGYVIDQSRSSQVPPGPPYTTC